MKAPVSSRTRSKDAHANSSFTLMSIYAKLLKQDALLKCLGKMKCPVSLSQCYRMSLSFKTRTDKVISMFPVDDP